MRAGAARRRLLDTDDGFCETKTIDGHPVCSTQDGFIAIDNDRPKGIEPELVVAAEEGRDALAGIDGCGDDPNMLMEYSECAAAFAGPVLLVLCRRRGASAPRDHAAAARGASSAHAPTAQTAPASCACNVLPPPDLCARIAALAYRPDCST